MTSRSEPTAASRYRCSECGHGENLYGWSQVVAYGPVAADGLLSTHEYTDDCFIFENSLQCNLHPSAQIETRVDGVYCTWKRCEGRCKGEPEKLSERGYYAPCPDCGSAGGSWVSVEREAVVA